jgi:hypothetical protein
MSQSQFLNVEDNKSHRKSFHSHQHHDHVVVMLKHDDHYLNPKDIVGHTYFQQLFYVPSTVPPHVYAFISYLSP